LYFAKDNECLVENVSITIDVNVNVMLNTVAYISKYSLFTKQRVSSSFSL